MIERQVMAVDGRAARRIGFESVLDMVPRGKARARVFQYDKVFKPLRPVVEVFLVAHFPVFIAPEAPFVAAIAPPRYRGQADIVGAETEQSHVEPDVALKMFERGRIAVFMDEN